MSDELNFLIFLGGPFSKAPAEGAATSVYLASAPEAGGITGRYFVNW